MTHTGLYIALEGIDGAGKDRQGKMLAARLHDLGHDVVEEREPDERSFVGSYLRELLAEGKHAEAHALLFAADRMLAAPRRVAALEQARTIVQVRSFLSTYVYQAPRWGRAAIEAMHAHLVVVPHVIVVLTVPVNVALERIARRAGRAEAYERRAVLEAAAQGYAEAVSAGTVLGAKVVGIDGTGTWDEVHTRLMRELLTW